MSAGLLVPSTALLLAALYFVRLRKVGYSLVSALLVLAIAGLQAATAFTVAVLPSLFAALLLFLIGNATAEFWRSKDARSLLALGALLSIAQLLPFGLAMTIALLPLLAWRNRSSAASGKFGLLVLMLFMPAITAASLYFIGHMFHLYPADYLTSGFDRALAVAPAAGSGDALRAGLLCSLCLGILGFPVWICAADTLENAAIAIVAASVIAAVLAAALFGKGYPFAMFAPAFVGMSVAAIAEHPGRSSFRAISVCAVSAAFAWLAVLVPA